jgi:hypothetical protein
MGKSKDSNPTDTKESIRVIVGLAVKYQLKPEDIIKTMEGVDNLKHRAANRKLRDRIVWCLISSLGFEGLLILLHSAGLITLPAAVLIAISVMMGGSGLVAALLIIIKDLFPDK